MVSLGAISIVAIENTGLEEPSLVMPLPARPPIPFSGERR